MIESGYYPPGAEFDKDAPWNQTENEEREFEVTISQTLSKNVTLFTSDYNLEADFDEEGSYVNYDTSDTDWKKAYSEDHATIEELLKAFKDRLILEKSILEAKLDQNAETEKRIRECDYYISECEGWCVDDFEVVQ